MADGLTKPLSVTEHHQKFHYYLFQHLLQHNDKDVEMILPQPQNNHMQQISKNTSKKHNKLIKQLQNQQENTPKHDEATASTDPTEPTTQTPSTSTSLNDKNNKISPPIPQTYSTVTNSVTDKENPQDDGVIHPATESNIPIPERTLSLSSNKEPPPDDPPKNHDNKAFSRETEEPFSDPDQSNYTTCNTSCAFFVQQDDNINLLDKKNLI